MKSFAPDEGLLGSGRPGVQQADAKDKASGRFKNGKPDKAKKD